jgi:hypothetical protein
MPIVLKEIYVFNAIHIKIQVVTFFTEIEKTVLKFVWNYQGPQKAKASLNKKNKAKGIILFDLKTSYKAL